MVEWMRDVIIEAIGEHGPEVIEQTDERNAMTSLDTLAVNYDEMVQQHDWPVHISQKADAALGDDHRDARLEVLQATAEIALRKVGRPTSTNEYSTLTAQLPPEPDGTIIMVHTRLHEKLIIISTEQEMSGHKPVKLGQVKEVRW